MLTKFSMNFQIVRCGDCAPGKNGDFAIDFCFFDSERKNREVSYVDLALFCLDFKFKREGYFLYFAPWWNFNTPCTYE